MIRRLLVLAMLLAVLAGLSGCGKGGAQQGGSKIPADGKVAAADVDRVYAAVKSRPFSLVLTEGGQQLLDVRVAANLDCYLIPATGSPFVHKGIQAWEMDPADPMKVKSGPYWDQFIPQQPYTAALEDGCLERFPLLEAMSFLREQFTQSSEAGKTVWVAEVPTLEDNAAALTYLPGEERAIKKITFEIKELDGAVLPVKVTLYMADEEGKESTLEGVYSYETPTFPDLPAGEGFGLYGTLIGATRDQVEAPPNRPLAERFINPDGSERATDANVGREVIYDKPGGKVIGVKVTKNALRFGSPAIGDSPEQVERRFGKPSAASETEMRYDYPGGYRLVVELEGGKVKAIAALAPAN